MILSPEESEETPLYSPEEIKHEVQTQEPPSTTLSSPPTTTLQEKQQEDNHKFQNETPNQETPIPICRSQRTHKPPGEWWITSQDSQITQNPPSQL